MKWLSTVAICALLSYGANAQQSGGGPGGGTGSITLGPNVGPALAQPLNTPLGVTQFNQLPAPQSCNIVTNIGGLGGGSPSVQTALQNATATPNGLVPFNGPYGQPASIDLLYATDVVPTAGGPVASTGATGTCAANIKPGTGVQGAYGGTAAGAFSMNAPNCTGTITFVMPQTLDTSGNGGWTCPMRDITTPTNLWNETAYTPTSVTFTGTSNTNDRIVYGPCGQF